MDNDFADERTRLILNSAPKYCQGGTVSDDWAKRMTESWVRIDKAQPMPKGKQFVPGWFSWSRTIEYGSKVGATPNGIASVQCGYGNTAPLQIEFDPKLVVDRFLEGI